MGNNYNDLTTAARTIEDTAGNDKASGPCRVFSVNLAAAGDNASLTINNAATTGGGGTTVILRAVTNTSSSFSWEPTGVLFDTGLSIAETGTTPVWIVTYIAE